MTHTTFRFEITAALVLKVIMIIGLWFLIFRFDGKKPVPQADIAERFQLPAVSGTNHTSSHTTEPTLENPHVR